MSTPASRISSFILACALALPAGSAWASDGPYVARNPVRTSDGDWKVVVWNPDTGLGVIVKAKRKKDVKEKAEAKAEELNSEFYDPCTRDPGSCDRIE